MLPSLEGVHINSTSVRALALEDYFKDDIEGVESKGNHKKGKIPFLRRYFVFVLACAPLPSAGEEFGRTATIADLGYYSHIEAAGCAGSDVDLAKPPQSLLASIRKAFGGISLQVYTVDPAGGWRHWEGGGGIGGTQC